VQDSYVRSDSKKVYEIRGEYLDCQRCRFIESSKELGPPLSLSLLYLDIIKEPDGRAQPKNPVPIILQRARLDKELDIQ
jgi:hypothetical protein